MSSGAMARGFNMGLSRYLKRALSGSAQLSPEKQAYVRMASRGFRPDGIIDVGAYQGDWTRMAQSVFPGTPTLMIEAQPGKIPYLQAVCDNFPNVRFVSALLGRTSGEEVTFYGMETGSSFLPEQSNVRRTETVMSLSSLDDVARSFSQSLFLKIDVQGAELEVLAGGRETLSRCAAVQLELALLPYNKGAPTMLQVMTEMDTLGFAPFDVSGFSRPNGVDLVQLDMIFVPKDSRLRPGFFNF